MHIYSENLFITLYIKKNIQALQKFPLDNINIIKYVLFFVSRARSYHSFGITKRLLHEPKHEILRYKASVGICYFDSVFYV